MADKSWPHGTIAIGDGPAYRCPLCGGRLGEPKAVLYYGAMGPGQVYTGKTITSALGFTYRDKDVEDRDLIARACADCGLALLFEQRPAEVKEETDV